MALPTPRRPKEVEEELHEDFVAKQREQLKPRVDPQQIFINSMKTWYDGLKTKEKSHLTPKLLKRKAISCCFRLNLVYESLPLDWVKRLQDECGLKLYVKQKEKLTLTDDNCSEKATSGCDGVERPPNTAADKTDTKKYLDLSKEPPPPEWMRAYAEGFVLHRTLETYSTEDTNILFWDYSPSLKDEDGNVIKLAPTLRTNSMEVKDLNAKRELYKHGVDDLYEDSTR